MNKKTIILGGVLIVLIVLAYLYQGPLRKWQNNFGKPKNILAKIDTTKIDKIEIASGDQAIILSKQGDSSAGSAPVKWKYNQTKDFYADQKLMSNALESLRRAAASELELVSNNPERKSEFKTDSAGLTVKVYRSDKKIVDFIIGGSSSDNGNSYISTSQSRDTYVVKSDLRNAFEQAEWRDLTIFSTAKEKIKRVRFQYPNREFTVELKNDKWSGILPEKFTVSQEKIKTILDVMTNLKASKIPEQTFKNTGLEKHLIIIQAAGEAIDNTLMVGESRQGFYYAKKGDSDNIYLISKSDRDKLDKWIWQLR